MTSKRCVILVACVLGALCGRASGVRTAAFAEVDEKAFQKGEMEGTVWTSLGKMRLARDLATLVDEKADISYIAALAEARDGTIYAATSVKGEIYRIKKDKAEVLATLPDKNLFSLVVAPNGNLYVGSGGRQGRIYQVSAKGEVKTFFEPEKIQYIWALLCDSKNNIYAATGPTGKVFKITPQGKGKVLFTSKEKHILTLLLDPKGTLYAGTDGAALVYRYSPDGKLFVLYDAGEAEITALAMDEAGNLFVGASSATGGRAPAISRTPLSAPPTPSTKPGTPPGGSLTPGNKGAKTSETKPAKNPGGGKNATAPAAKKPSTMQSMMGGLRMILGPSVGGSYPSRRTSGSAGGNAVYKITPEGIVTSIFQSGDGMVLALAVDGDTVLAGTGATKTSKRSTGPKGGRIYEIRLDGEEQSPLVTVGPKQVMSLLRSSAGEVIIGTATPGKLYVMRKDFVKQGKYVSSVFDAGASARWGNIRWRAQLPGKTSISLATRSGNVKDPKSGEWSNWSSEIRKSPGLVVSPTARFVQFRATLQTANPQASPVLDEVEVAYLTTNLPPKILRITADGIKKRTPRSPQMSRSSSGQPSNPARSTPVKKVSWQAQDPNRDKLRYEAWFRSVGDSLWILLKDDLTASSYSWDTRTVADGWYEIKIVATDAPDNPQSSAKTASKISEPILVDNTAPVVRNLKAKIADGTVEVTADMVDATSNITSACYVVDSGDAWHALAPEGQIFDSQKEFLKFKIKDLEPGEHRIAIQVIDKAGNVGNGTLSIEIKPK